MESHQVKIELDDDVIDILNKETPNGNNIIVVIDNDSYMMANHDNHDNGNDGHHADYNWKFKYVNVGLDMINKKILEYVTFTTNIDYKLPKFYNRNLIIKVNINKSSKIVFDSIYFISLSIKKNLLNALEINYNDLEIQ
jgi:hypothetical protein